MQPAGWASTSAGPCDIRRLHQPRICDPGVVHLPEMAELMRLSECRPPDVLNFHIPYEKRIQGNPIQPTLTCLTGWSPIDELSLDASAWEQSPGRSQIKIELLLM